MGAQWVGRMGRGIGRGGRGIGRGGMIGVGGDLLMDVDHGGGGRVAGGGGRVVAVVAVERPVAVEVVVGRTSIAVARVVAVRVVGVVML